MHSLSHILSMQRRRLLLSRGSHSMKPILRCLTIAIVLALLVWNTGAQSLDGCLLPPSKEVGKRNHDCGDWKRLMIRQVGICLPKDYAVANAPSVEGGSFAYETEGLRFSIDYNVDAWRPLSETRLPSFKEEVIENPNARLWIWRYQDSERWKYVEGLNIWAGDRHNYVAGMYMFTNSEKHQKLARRIFESACYRP